MHGHVCLWWHCPVLCAEWDIYCRTYGFESQSHGYYTYYTHTHWHLDCEVILLASPLTLMFLTALFSCSLLLMLQTPITASSTVEAEWSSLSESWGLHTYCTYLFISPNLPTMLVWFIGPYYTRTNSKYTRPSASHWNWKDYFCFVFTSHVDFTVILIP